MWLNFLLFSLRKIPVYLWLYTNNFQSKLLTNSVYFCLGLFSWLLGICTISLRNSLFYTCLTFSWTQVLCSSFSSTRQWAFCCCIHDFSSSLACGWYYIILLYYYSDILWLILFYPPSSLFSLGKSPGKHTIIIFSWVLWESCTLLQAVVQCGLWVMFVNRNDSWTFLTSKPVTYLPQLWHVLMLCGMNENIHGIYVCNYEWYIWNIKQLLKKNFMAIFNKEKW